MTCQEFREIGRDYARGEWMSVPARQGAADHLEVCAACRERLRNEQELERGMAALREADRVSLAAPDAVRLAVLAEFDRAQGSGRWPVGRARVGAWMALAAAAGFGLAVWLGGYRNDTVGGNTAPVLSRVDKPAEAVEPAVAEDVEPLAVQPGRRVRPRPQLASRERVTGFLPIGTGRPVEPGEELRVLRIQLPESELVRLGIPMAPRLEQGYVRADVLLGEDGQARAIRFVY